MYRKILLLSSAVFILFLMDASFPANTSSKAETSFSLAADSAGIIPTCVAVFLYPDNSLESMAIGDIVTANLLKAGMKVVSSETIIRTSQRLARQAEEARLAEEQKTKSIADSDETSKSITQKKSEAAKKQDIPFLDNLAIAKEAGADCIIKINILFQTIQQNIYDTEGRRVTEVRTESKVSLITVCVVSNSGNILKVGSASYPEPVSVAYAADDFGKELVRGLKQK